MTDNIVYDVNDSAAVQAAFLLYHDFGESYPVTPDGWPIPPIDLPSQEFIEELRDTRVKQKTLWLYEIGELGRNEKD